MIRMGRIAYATAIAVVSSLVGLIALVTVVPRTVQSEVAVSYAFSWFSVGLPVLVLLGAASAVLQKSYVGTVRPVARAALFLGNVLVVAGASLAAAWIY